MAPLFKQLRELDPSNVNQAVKLRLIRCYTLHVGDNVNDVYSLECVLHDSEGNRIHASIKKTFISRFRALLKEEHIFAINNFLLADNTMALKTSSAQHKIVFIPKTSVAEMFDDNFPRFVFDFKLYDNLELWDTMEEEYLIDVIGSISSRSTMQTRDVRGRPAAMLDIWLMNLHGCLLPCTLWADYAEQVHNYVEANEGPVVLILQMCRVRKFRGEVRLSNTFKVSKVIFDPNVPEIQDFKSLMVLDVNAVIPVRNSNVPPTLTKRDELQMAMDKILSLDRLIRVQEIDHFCSYYQIVSIEPMFNWFYVSCKKCYKKMAQAGATFYCVTFDSCDPVGNLRYKVLVRVEDNWGVACFILWDKECVDLIGKTAAELQSSARGQEVPLAIKRLVGIKALFKVNVKDLLTAVNGVNLGLFPVMKMTRDVTLIKKKCDMDSLSNVGLLKEIEPQPVFAPARPIPVRSVPEVVRVGIKRNLMEAFAGNEGDDVVGVSVKEEDVHVPVTVKQEDGVEPSSKDQA